MEYCNEYKVRRALHVTPLCLCVACPVDGNFDLKVETKKTGRVCVPWLTRTLTTATYTVQKPGQVCGASQRPWVAWIFVDLVHFVVAPGPSPVVRMPFSTHLHTNKNGKRGTERRMKMMCFSVYAAIFARND